MCQPETKFNPAPTMTSDPVMARSRFPVWLMAALLALVTIALYWPAMSHDFVNYDDNLFVTSNVRVQNGLTLENVKWAFCNPVNNIWHPLTVLSHMLDCQLFGLNPWGHHLTSVLLHAANTVLVFLLLRNLTGAIWRSVLVAALFGLHPLRVESVAWVAERKDVLSTCFGLLALIFYVRYARRVTSDTCQVTRTNSTLSPVTRHPSLFYWLALFLFALGLMSKPMLVTWPFVMLLLDYWPLERFKHSSVWRLVTEKIPFFVLAAGTSIVTFVVQKQTSALVMVEDLPLGARSGNALISYCRYLGELFWPRDLAVFYPHPGHWAVGQVVLAGGLILGMTVFFIMGRGRYPFLLMGWLWYCGTLVPVIGMVQVGEQAMADRYTYIPSLGVLVVVIWGAYELTRRWRYQVMALSVAGCAAIVLCIGLTRQQLGYWKDSETLYRHALEVTENNYLVHNNLGVTLLEKDQIDEAIRQYQEAIRLKPSFVCAHYNLGTTLLKKDQIDEAIRQFQDVIRLTPDDADAHFSLGTALGRKGQTDEAIRQFQEVVRLEPDFAEVHYNLGNALGRKGQTDKAISQFQEAIHLKPDFVEAHYNLANMLAQKDQFAEAIAQYQKTIQLNPDYAEAHYNLGAVFGVRGRLDEAVEQYQKAIQIKPDYADAHGNLANVLATQDKLDEAVKEYQRTLELVPNSAQAHFRFGQALQTLHNFAAAKAEYQKVLELDPKHLAAHLSLAWLLATCPEVSIRNGAKAVELTQQAERLGGGESPQILDTLAAAYAEAGRYPEAVETAKRALNLTATQNNKPLAEAIQARLKLYEAGSPYHEKP